MNFSEMLSPLHGCKLAFWLSRSQKLFCYQRKDASLSPPLVSLKWKAATVNNSYEWFLIKSVAKNCGIFKTYWKSLSTSLCCVHSWLKMNFDLDEGDLCICSSLLLLSRFSRVRLCATPQTAAQQASPSLGFSRQEHWSGLPLPSPMHESEKWKWSHSVVSDS